MPKELNFFYVSTIDKLPQTARQSLLPSSPTTASRSNTAACRKHSKYAYALHKKTKADTDILPVPAFFIRNEQRKTTAQKKESCASDYALYAVAAATFLPRGRMPG
ncbi:MAG: hypothetical protein ACI4RV_01785 [Eubacteriales bacterium]